MIKRDLKGRTKIKGWGVGRKETDQSPTKFNLISQNKKEQKNGNWRRKEMELNDKREVKWRTKRKHWVQNSISFLRTKKETKNENRRWKEVQLNDKREVKWRTKIKRWGGGRKRLTSDVQKSTSFLRTKKKGRMKIGEKKEVQLNGKLEVKWRMKIHIWGGGDRREWHTKFNIHFLAQERNEGWKVGDEKIWNRIIKRKT